MTSLPWFVRRLRRAGLAEAGWRVRSSVEARRWRTLAPRQPDTVLARRPAPLRPIVLPDPTALAATVRAADLALSGRWPVLGAVRADVGDPSWTDDGWPDAPCDLDGTPARHSRKHVWDFGRHHAATVLAAAWAGTGDTRYADRALGLLESWWTVARDPQATWWTGVELAQRLISWVWVRRLLDGHPGVGTFETPMALWHLHRHQDALERFPSRFSSANNHRMAEAAGLLAASSALPWFAESARWRAVALDALEHELREQVGPGGLQREAAPAYHCFAFDLAVVALAEAAAAGAALAPDTPRRLRRMAEALGAVCDDHGGLVRFGDADDSRVADMDGYETVQAQRSLSLASACVGPSLDGPPVTATVRAAWVAGLAGGALRSAPTRTRAEARAEVAADTGPAVLTCADAWAALRCGPFGYRSIAAHAHADLLALELRLGERAVLVDPGTAAYEALPEWHRALRSTARHDTIAVDGKDQATPWGPFLWASAPPCVLRAWRTAGPTDEPGGPTGGDTAHAAAEHCAYRGVLHRRSITLIPHQCAIVDELTALDGHRGSGRRAETTWTFGPDVTDPVLDGGRLTARLGDRSLTMDLAPWRWRLVRGGDDGWWWPRFGVPQPVWTLRGEVDMVLPIRFSTVVTWS